MHLDKPFFDCSALIHEGLLIKPGLCPFCLGNASLPAHKRFQPFQTSHAVIVHIHTEHVHDLPWPSKCPHPSCFTQKMNRDEYHVHMIVKHNVDIGEYGLRKARIELASQSPSPVNGAKKGDDEQSGTSSTSSDQENAPARKKSRAIVNESRASLQTDRSPGSREKHPGGDDPGSTSFEAIIETDDQQPRFTLDGATEEEAKATAERIWREQGYPDIDWSRIPDRTQELLPWLETCLEAKFVPIFRERYETYLADDTERRTAAHHIHEAQYFHSGYYGQRGQSEV